MSDDDFMLEDDYDFEGSESEDGEVNVALENKYYLAKSIII